MFVVMAGFPCVHALNRRARLFQISQFDLGRVWHQPSSQIWSKRGMRDFLASAFILPIQLESWNRYHRWLS